MKSCIFLIIGIVLVITAIAIGESALRLYKTKKEKVAMCKGIVVGVMTTIIAIIGGFFIILHPMSNFYLPNDKNESIKQINVINFDSVDSISIDSIQMWQIK